MSTQQTIAEAMIRTKYIDCPECTAERYYYCDDLPPGHYHTSRTIAKIMELLNLK